MERLKVCQQSEGRPVWAALLLSYPTSPPLLRLPGRALRDPGPVSRGADWFCLMVKPVASGSPVPDLRSAASGKTMEGSERNAWCSTKSLG